MVKELIGELELNRIYRRDCIEGMRLLPDDSVDLIVIDPPYNIGKDKRWDKWRSVDDYVAWMTDVFRECERVLKPNGSFYWFHNDFPQIRKLMDTIDENTSFIFKQLITCQKPKFRVFAWKNPTEKSFVHNWYSNVEYCLFYTFQDETGRKLVDYDLNNYKSLRNYFKERQEKTGFYWNGKEIPEAFLKSGISKNIKSARVVAKHKLDWNYRQLEFITKKHYEILKPFLQWDRSYKELREEYEQLREEYEKQRYVFNKDDNISCVWVFDETNSGKYHPTQKPLNIIEKIIRTSSNAGAVVLDCFMGSGTTAVAAAKLNRNFIGFEREPEYIKIANQRLEAERKPTEVECYERI